MASTDVIPYAMSSSVVSIILDLGPMLCSPLPLSSDPSAKNQSEPSSPFDMSIHPTHTHLLPVPWIVESCQRNLVYQGNYSLWIDRNAHVDIH